MFGSHSIPQLGALPPQRADVPGDQFDIFSPQDVWGPAATSALLGIDCRQSQAMNDIRALYPGWSGDPIGASPCSVLDSHAVPHISDSDPAAKLPPLTQPALTSAYPSLLDHLPPQATAPSPLELGLEPNDPNDAILSAARAVSFDPGLRSPSASPTLQPVSAFSSEPVSASGLWSVCAPTFPVPPVGELTAPIVQDLAEHVSLNHFSRAVGRRQPNETNGIPMDGHASTASIQSTCNGVSLPLQSAIDSMPTSHWSLPPLPANTDFPTTEPRLQLSSSSLRQLAFQAVSLDTPTCDFDSGSDLFNLGSLAALMMSSRPALSCATSPSDRSASEAQCIGPPRLETSNETEPPSVFIQEMRSSPILARDEMTASKKTSSRGRKVTEGVSDARKFRCHVCGAGFQRLEHKNRHVLCRHESDKGRAFSPRIVVTFSDH